MKKIWMLSLWLSIALAGCMGYVPGRQSYWDAQVREMCDRDGGVTVYERIDIDEDHYKKLGGSGGVIPVPDERSKIKNYPYFSRSKQHEINSNPQVTRMETEVVRVFDNKVLGRVINYLRIGGDFPTGIQHDTSFSCKDIPGVRLDVEKQVFVIRRGAK